MPLSVGLRSLVLVLTTGGLAARSARAEHLAFRHYGDPEGVAETQFSEIFPDSKGYLWFAGTDGLSRFDGYTSCPSRAWAARTR